MIVKHFFWINLLLLVLVLFCTSCKDSNQESNSEIDSLLHKARFGTENLRYSETLKYAKEAENLSQETNNLGRLPDIYLEMADGLAGLEMQEESFSYLQKILKMDFGKKDKIFKARTYQIYAYNYLELGIASQSFHYSNMAVKILASAQSPRELDFLSRSYGDISLHHYSLLNTDSAFHYFDKWQTVLKQRKEKDAVFDIASYYNLKGFLFLEQTKRRDSALYYFQKGYNLKKKYNDPVLDLEYLGLGYVYLAAKDYQKALEYFLKAEQNIKERKINTNDNNSVNELLANTYEVIGDMENHNIYLKKYKNYNDSVQSVHKNNVSAAVGILMKEKTEETLVVSNNYKLLLLLAAAIIFIGGFFIFRSLKKKNKRADQNEELLREKVILLSQKDEETQDLKQKVNQSFDKVVQLAKDNSPEFLTLFQEVYFNFAKKLKDRYPDISNDDLRFCAFLKLNFSTKDISDFTFVTVRTVQTRKSRLRKKLNIPSDMDIYLWISGFEE